MLRFFKMHALLALILLCAIAPAKDNWVGLDFPGAKYSAAHGIDGDRIVRRYPSYGAWHGLVYTIPEPPRLLETISKKGNVILSPPEADEESPISAGETLRFAQGDSFEIVS